MWNRPHLRRPDMCVQSDRRKAVTLHVAWVLADEGDMDMDGVSLSRRALGVTQHLSRGFAARSTRITR